MKILKITNLKTGHVQQSDFQTIAECEEHFLKHKWGEEEKTITHTSYEINHPEVLEVKDELGAVVVVGSPAWKEVIPERIEIVPCEYKKEILDVQEPIPSISPRQIRLALLSLGITEAMVEAQINLLPSPDKEAAMIAWKYSTSFERFLPIVEQMGLSLGFDANALNLLWKNGALL